MIDLAAEALFYGRWPIVDLAAKALFYGRWPIVDKRKVQFWGTALFLV